MDLFGEQRTVTSCNGVTVREVTAGSALSPSKLEGLDYSLNPYRGCGMGCRYCYGPAILREERPWGTFVDVRRNMPQVLAKEMKRRPKGVVGLSTVTDPYQPVEKDLEVTRRCLEVLLRKNWPISIQTKSTLVARDISLLKLFTHADIGMTITSVDDEVRRLYEPNTSPAEEQFQVLGGLGQLGRETWVYVAPIIPFVTEGSVDQIVLQAWKAGVRTIMVDGLRPRGRAWDHMEAFIKDWRPELLEGFRDIRKDPGPYFRAVAARFEKACRQRDLGCHVFVGSDVL